MQSIRKELANAMASMVAESVREWAEDNLPKNISVRIVIRDWDQHVEATVSRYNSRAKNWTRVLFVFPGAADDKFVDNVMVGMLAELSTK